MEKKFTPYEKLSKKKRRELDRKRRNTWGSLNPVTRKPANPKAYNRQKVRNWNHDDFQTVPSVLCVKEILAGADPRLSFLFR